MELLKEILKARVYDVAKRTPLDRAFDLSLAWENDIRIKREDLQPIFSFKIRGAYNKIISLSPEERSRGVICASAGNHGQGVALSAKLLNIPAWVVMPTTTPDIKIQAVARHKAEIVLFGNQFSEASIHSQELARSLGAVMVHPFDDRHVIAGQGTIGREILEDCPDVEYIFVPIGGGGLIAGIAAYVKALNPDVQIIGVEPSDSDAMSQSVEAGSRIVLAKVGAFADGVAVRQVGEQTFRIVQEHVDTFVRVSTDEICSAIQDIYRETRTIVEPAGALSWAGAKSFIRDNALKNKTIVTINSGANMNFQRLQFAAERALTGAGLECLVAIRLPERRGALKEFCLKAISDRNITEFNYRSNDSAEAYLLLGVATPNPGDRQRFYDKLLHHGYWYKDLTDNELAKDHVRHMVGGRPPRLLEEQLYSFSFPDRSRALIDFLSVMSDRWNISLFHYRSHGSDYGKVLIAFEISHGEQDDFESHLRQTGCDFTRETHNLVFSMFLQASFPKPSTIA